MTADHNPLAPESGVDAVVDETHAVQAAVTDGSGSAKSVALIAAGAVIVAGAVVIRRRR